jgi:hypothetical protein
MPLDVESANIWPLPDASAATGTRPGGLPGVVQRQDHTPQQVPPRRNAHRDGDSAAGPDRRQAGLRLGRRQGFFKVPTAMAPARKTASARWRYPPVQLRIVSQADLPLGGLEAARDRPARARHAPHALQRGRVRRTHHGGPAPPVAPPEPPGATSLVLTCRGCPAPQTSSSPRTAKPYAWGLASSHLRNRRSAPSPPSPATHLADAPAASARSSIWRASCGLVAQRRSSELPACRQRSRSSVHALGPCSFRSSRACPSRPASLSTTPIGQFSIRRAVPRRALPAECGPFWSKLVSANTSTACGSPRRWMTSGTARRRWHRPPRWPGPAGAGSHTGWPRHRLPPIASGSCAGRD